MFRAVHEFDGSDSEKCVTLKLGDKLSAVHVVDNKWYIGYNERSGQTGAFPASCVVSVEGNVGKSRTLDPKYTKVQRSGSLSLVDDHHVTFNSQSLDRNKCLSLGAIHFDEDRLETTKAKRNVRLKSLNTLPGSTTTDISNDTTANTVPNLDVKDEMESNVINKASDKENTEHTDGPKLLHAISMTDSVIDWHESSFEDSFQQTTSEEKGDDVIKPSEELSMSESPAEANNENLNKKKGMKSDEITKSKMLLHVFSAFCGLLFLGLVFSTSVFVFKYPVLVAGILTAIVTIIFVVLFIFTSAMRCVLLILFPSMVSSVGQTFLYVLLLCLILNGPIMHLSKNIHQTGSGISCAIDRVAHQHRALHRKSMELENNIMTHVQEQKSLLLSIHSDVSREFDTIESNISVIDDHLDVLIGNMTSVYQNCSQPLDDKIPNCFSICSLFSDQYLKLRCETECKKLEGMKRLCKVLDIGGNIAEASTKSKAIMNRARDTLQIGMSIRTDGNITKHSLVDVQLIVDKKLNDIASVFEGVIRAAEILMSLSLGFLLVWAFIVYRRFLSENEYNNVYINNQFREFDVLNAKETEGQTVLPLKHVEKEDYTEITSTRLPRRYYSIINRDFITLLGHLFILSILVLLNCGLWYIINTIKSKIQEREPYVAPESFDIKVLGIGPVAYFYKNLFNGVHIYDDFVKGTKASLQGCLHGASHMLDTSSVLGFVSLYIIMILVIVFHGYAPRLQATIFSFYHPNVAQERVEYLHAKIICNRQNMVPFAAQLAKSHHKEIVMKRKLSPWSKLATYLPCLKNTIKDDVVRYCIGCGNSEGELSKMSICYCTLHLSTIGTNFCDECKEVLDEQCPICI